MLRKLNQREEFDMALRGHVRARTEHFVLHLCKNDSALDAGLGAVVPKRWAKRAVTRNLIKRQIHQQAGQTQTGLVCGHVAVVRLKAAFSRETWVSACSDALRRAVQQELSELYARLEKSLPTAVATTAAP